MMMTMTMAIMMMAAMMMTMTMTMMIIKTMMMVVVVTMMMMMRMMMTMCGQVRLPYQQSKTSLCCKNMQA